MLTLFTIRKGLTLSAEELFSEEYAQDPDVLRTIAVNYGAPLIYADLDPYLDDETPEPYRVAENETPLSVDDRGRVVGFSEGGLTFSWEDGIL